MAAVARLRSIYRYPVKGLSPEPLDGVRLRPGETLPADRQYAIENGPSGFDAAAPSYFPKAKFLMLMRDERLAALRTVYDGPTTSLVIHDNGREAARGDLRTSEGRKTIEDFFLAFMPDDLRGPPRVLESPGHSFSDVAKKVVSIINLESVARLEAALGAPVDPLRFRANLYVAGWPAWSELELLGRTIAVGSRVRLKAVKRIQRCAATNVDPRTGVRDMNIPKLLMNIHGHADCGIYTEVMTGGEIAPGDQVSVIDPVLV